MKYKGGYYVTKTGKLVKVYEQHFGDEDTIIVDPPGGTWYRTKGKEFLKYARPMREKVKPRGRELRGKDPVLVNFRYEEPYTWQMEKDIKKHFPGAKKVDFSPKLSRGKGSILTYAIPANQWQPGRRSLIKDKATFEKIIGKRDLKKDELELRM